MILHRLKELLLFHRLHLIELLALDIVFEERGFDGPLLRLNLPDQNVYGCCHVIDCVIDLSIL